MSKACARQIDASRVATPGFLLVCLGSRLLFHRSGDDSAPSVAQHAAADTAPGMEAAASAGCWVPPSTTADSPRSPLERLCSVPASAPAVSLIDGRCVPSLDRQLDDAELSDDVANLPAEVAALLRDKGLAQQFSSKQKKWQEMKVRSLQRKIILCCAAG